MYNIKPVIFENYNCLETIIANILKHYKKQWKLMFIGNLGFDYQINNDEGFWISPGYNNIKVLNEIYSIYQTIEKVKYQLIYIAEKENKMF